MDSSELQLPFVLKHSFFLKEIPDSKSKRIAAVCVHCEKELKGSLLVTSNFLTHLKRKHPTEFKDYKGKKLTRGPNLKQETYQLSYDTQKAMHTHTHSKQYKIKASDRKTVDDLITDYFIHAMRPTNEVENNIFMSMINGIKSISDAEAMPTADQISEYICEQYTQINTYISKAISEVDYISTTNSILNCGKQIYIGMCIHWIDKETFEHKTATLCCRRFKDQLIPEHISAFIADIYEDFDIVPEKVVKTTINGDLNETNGISLFDLNPHHTDSSQDDPLVIDLKKSKEKLGIVSNSLLTYSDIEEILKNCDDTSYHKCCSYVLNLLVVADTAAAIQKEPLYLRQVFESTFAKCSALFTKINGCNESLRLFEDIVDKIPKSDGKRWGSEYNLLNILNRASNETLTQALLLLELDDFIDCEYQCLQEYTTLLKPIVEALKRFENVKFCFYGEVVPVLYTLKAKLQSPCKNKVSYCNNIRQALAVQLTERFGDIFKQSFYANDALLAAISNPFFKRRWIKNDEVLSKYVTDLLISTAESMANDLNPNDKNNREIDLHTNNDDFFDFGDTVDDNVSTNQINTQIKAYLEDIDTSYVCLNKYPVVRNIFFLTNTISPSTAKTDRIFAEAVITLDSQGVEWNEDLLQKQLFCKYNKKCMPIESSTMH